MKILFEESHPECRITVFHWNGKYIIKFERGDFEQVYKIRETEVAGDEEIKLLIKNKTFLASVKAHFKIMYQNVSENIK